MKPEVYNSHRDLFRQTLWTLLDVGDEQPTRTTRTPASTVTINWVPQNAHQVSATYFALRGSRSVRKISIPPTYLESRPTASSGLWCFNWLWIAYAVFSGKQGGLQSRKHLEVYVKELQTVDVHRMRTLLQSCCPLAWFLSIGRVRTRVNDPVDTITASHFLLSDPEVDVEPRFVSGRRLSGDPVLNETGKWLEVLMPAWGRAWVCLSDIEVYTTGVLDPHTVHSIHTLTLTQMCASSMTPVLEWLRFIGQGVHRLVIKDFHGNSRIDDWLRELFVVCPLLEELEMSGCRLQSLQLFADCYASGVCRLRRLAFGCLTIDEVNAGMAGLLVVLTDKHHAASIHLRELACTWMKAQGPVDQRLFVLIKRMLEENNRLRVFEVASVSLVQPTWPWKAWPTRSPSKARRWS